VLSVAEALFTDCSEPGPPPRSEGLAGGGEHGRREADPQKRGRREALSQDVVQW
jgi:hypothetical protein